MTSLRTQDAVSLIEAFRDGLASPCDVLFQTRGRIDKFQSQINAYSYQNEGVVQDASASEQRWANKQPIGALDGIPIIIKVIWQ